MYWFFLKFSKIYLLYEVLWITIFIMGMLGLLFDISLSKILDKFINENFTNEFNIGSRKIKFKN